MASDEWEIYVVDEVLEWIEHLDDAAHARVVHAIDALAAGGPGLGRPLVDTITGSRIQHLKELRPGTVRILFVFDPWRSTVLRSLATRRDSGTPGTGRRFRWPNNGMTPI